MTAQPGPAASRHTRTILWIALLLSVSLHLAIAYFWPMPQQATRQPMPAPALSVYLTPLRPASPAIRPQPAVKDTPAPLPDTTTAQAAHKPAPAKKALQPLSRMQTAVAPAPVPTVAAMPATPATPAAADSVPAQPAASAPAPAHLDIDAVMSAAKRNIGRIDRDLRAAAPASQKGALGSEQTRLATGIAAAGRSSTPSMREIILPDGKRITRVSGGGTSYCVTHESAGATDGIDVMQQGARMKVTNCGHLFD